MGSQWGVLYQPPPEGQVGLTIVDRPAKFAALVDCLMALMIALAEPGVTLAKPCCTPGVPLLS